MYNFVDTWRTGGGIGILKCAARFVWYWFRFPTGWPVSGHEYVEQADGSLRCQDCGRVSE